MIGRVGTIFGAHGINISSAAVGHTPDGSRGEGAQRLAAMVVTTDAPVPEPASSPRSSPPRASSTAGPSTSAEACPRPPRRGAAIG